MATRRFRLSWRYTDGYIPAKGTVDEWDYGREEFEAASDEEAAAIADKRWKEIWKNLPRQQTYAEEEIPHLKPRAEPTLVELERVLDWKPAL